MVLWFVVNVTHKIFRYVFGGWNGVESFNTLHEIDLCMQHFF